MERIILASKSPRRSQLLRMLGMRFSVCSTEIDESLVEGENPESYTTRLAIEKALSPSVPNNSIVIAADTTVVLRGEILGKPKDEKEAILMLSKLSGKSHYVYTATALRRIKTGSVFHECKVSKVTFKELSEGEIEWYVRSREPLDKAGSYGIQGLGSLFIEKIEGDFFAIMGLSLFSLRSLFSKAGIDIYEYISNPQIL